MLLLLAGGSGERMGGGKPFIDIDGRPLWRWMADGLRDHGLDVTVSTGATVFDTGPFPHVADPADGLGPLGGLAAFAGEDLMVWSVDVPDWTPGELDVLARGGSDVVSHLVDASGRPQPLLARWPASITARIPGYIDTGQRSVMGFLDGIESEPVGLPRDRVHLTTRTDVEEWLRSQP